MNLYFYRLLGAATLDAGMYEGIEVDRTVTGQAVLTVLLSSLATGIGATAWFGMGPLALVSVSAVALVTWVAWAVLIFNIGTWIVPGTETRTDLGELLRTTGFAAAPGLLQVIAAIPPAAVPVFAITTTWMIAAMVVAVKHALHFQSMGRAITVCLTAAALCVLVAFGLAVLLSHSVV
jgi:Yip1-like protein